MPLDGDAFQLGSGLSLVRLEAPLTVFDLASGGAVGFREWAVLEPLASGCTSEIVSAEDAAILPGYDALNRAWLASALILFRRFGSHLCVACSAYSWNRIAGHQQRTSLALQEQILKEDVDAAVFNSKGQLPKFKGGLLDFQLSFFTERDTKDVPLTQEDAIWIRRRFDTFNELAANSKSFRFALEAAVDWRFAKDKRAAIARLWSGIEAVFGMNSELVFRISLLAASLLAPRGQQRKEKSQEIRKLYSVRSKVVHGGEVKEEHMNRAMNDSFQLLKSLILLSAERGHSLGPKDFDEALFF